MGLCYICHSYNITSVSEENMSPALIFIEKCDYQIGRQMDKVIPINGSAKCTRHKNHPRTSVSNFNFNLFKSMSFSFAVDMLISN